MIIEYQTKVFETAFTYKMSLNVFDLQAERDLRVAQSDFDRQAEITKLLLEGIGSTQNTHLR
jgi:hypothetical protein